MFQVRLFIYLLIFKEIIDFNQQIQTLNETLEQHSSKIEKEKLKALGMKNQLYEEAESKANKEQELKLLIKEKHEELERLRFQYQSLEKIENEQKMHIEKLSNNDENYI